MVSRTRSVVIFSLVLVLLLSSNSLAQQYLSQSEIKNAQERFKSMGWSESDLPPAGARIPVLPGSSTIYPDFWEPTPTTYNNNSSTPTGGPAEDPPDEDDPDGSTALPSDTTSPGASNSTSAPVDTFIGWVKGQCRNIPGTEYRVYHPDNADVWLELIRPSVVVIDQSNIFEIRVREIYDEYVQTECWWSEQWTSGTRGGEWRRGNDVLVKQRQWELNNPVSYDRVESPTGTISWVNGDANQFKENGHFVVVWNEPGRDLGVLQAEVTVHPNRRVVIRATYDVITGVSVLK